MCSAWRGGGLVIVLDCLCSAIWPIGRRVPAGGVLVVAKADEQSAPPPPKAQWARSQWQRSGKNGDSQWQRSTGCCAVFGLLALL